MIYCKDLRKDKGAKEGNSFIRKEVNSHCLVEGLVMLVLLYCKKKNVKTQTSVGYTIIQHQSYKDNMDFHMLLCKLNVALH